MITYTQILVLGSAFVKPWSHPNSLHISGLCLMLFHCPNLPIALHHACHLPATLASDHPTLSYGSLHVSFFPARVLFPLLFCVSPSRCNLSFNVSLLEIVTPS